MSLENKKNQPVLLFGLTIIFLVLLSFIPADIDLGIMKTKEIDLLIDIKNDSLTGIHTPENYINKNISTASLFNEISLLMNLIEPGPVSSESLSGNISQMNFFFEALKNSKSGNLRAAHFGDSAIEGDMITADLRLNLQKQFGGSGAGFLSITSKDTRFRVSTKHTFSDDWQTLSIAESSSLTFPPGISGSVSIPKSGSWVKYEVSGIGSSPKHFNTVRVFYTRAKKSALTFQFDNNKERKIELEQGEGVKELTLQSEGDARSILLKSTADGQALFFGVSLESGTGIYVDNFPLRGNSGLSLETIPENILSGFDSLMNYKLIILNFGLNLVSEMNEYSKYEKQMVKVIERLKKAFPEVSFLIISVGDKSMKKGSRFMTDPNVPKLVAVQKRIAVISGCAFWNLYEAMGGENSMHKWVTSSPPLASKDYTHINLDGAKKIADMLADAIVNANRNK